MPTITIDDALVARLQAALPQAKIADVSAFAIAVISDAVAKLEHETNTPAVSVAEAPFAEAPLPNPNGGEKLPTQGKPLAQFVEEQRIKHGFPDSWGTGEVVLTQEDWQRIDAAFADTK